MSKYELGAEVKPIVAQVPVIKTANYSTPGVDISAGNSSQVLAYTAEPGIALDATNNIQVKIEHSTDNGDTDAYAAVPEGQLGSSTITDGIFATWITNAAAKAGARISYTGVKKWLRVTFLFNGAHGTGTYVTAIVEIGDPVDNPVA